LQEPHTRRAGEDLELYVDELDLAWQAFLTSGGFPRAVAEHYRADEVSTPFLQDLAAWLHRDVDADAAEDSVGRLLSALQMRSTSPLNRTKLAEDVNYPSRHVLDVRLNRLVRTFAAVWCHQVGVKGERIPSAHPKLYLTDPILAWIGPRLRSGLPEPDFTQLTEAALGCALARAIDTAEPERWATNDSIGYARTGHGNEVDFAPVPARGPSGPMMTTPIESKWVVTGWRTEARSIEAKFHAGIVATRTIQNYDHESWAIPAPVLALLLG
jgi:predicted AAA+ superfamily ATPase